MRMNKVNIGYYSIDSLSPKIVLRCSFNSSLLMLFIFPFVLFLLHMYYQSASSISHPVKYMILAFLVTYHICQTNVILVIQLYYGNQFVFDLNLCLFRLDLPAIFTSNVSF